MAGKTYEDSSGKTFATHDAAAASNTSMGTNPATKKSSGGGGTSVPTAAPNATLEGLQKQLNDASTQLSAMRGTPNAQQTGATAQKEAKQGALVYDPSKNPSVVDLLNSTGADSSPDARAALAKSYGIQNYTGSASQNVDLAKKYTDFFNKNKGTEAPGENPRGQMQEQMAGTNADGTPGGDTPEQGFLKGYFAMNPVLKSFYDQVQQVISPTNTRQSFAEEYEQLVKQQGIPGLQTDLVNINNIIDGTEDDIRQEVTAAGGFATDSQVMALSSARNKVLIKRANALQQTLENKEHYVDQIMQFSKADREFVENDIDRRLGLTQTMVGLVDSMNKNAATNYRNLVGDIGYGGLAKGLQGHPDMLNAAEQSLGLPLGALSDPDWLSQVAAIEDPQVWGDPYMMGGDYVQKNQKTGEIRTAVNVPKGGSDSVVDTRETAVGNDLTDAYDAVSKGADPIAAKREFLKDHPSASATWDNYFKNKDGDVEYPSNEVQGPGFFDKVKTFFTG